MPSIALAFLLLLLAGVENTAAFATTRGRNARSERPRTTTQFQSLYHTKSSNIASSLVLCSSNNNNNNINNDNNNNDGLGEKFGGYTAKQRLREEVESPFRKVRFVFFLATVGSALTALYFSALSTFKAVVGGYADAPPLEQALQTDAINLAGVVVCGILASREYRIGQANLERIAKGGALARLVVEPATGGRQTLADYRRAARVMIAAGGPEYIAELARTLNSDQQLADTNVIPQKLADAEVIVVPVLLQEKGDAVVAAETRDFWLAVDADDKGRNFDIARSNQVVAFPRGSSPWTEYLESEVETASGQGFNVLEKGITITVKKNGRILRRATGQPPFADFLGAMEVMDGSKFGMPGDSERYGDP
jgi:hypothetical protein